jgi:RNA polymerase sigma factor (sigma-70 family)
MRNQYQRFLEGCCRSIGLDAEATEDVIQLTWIQIAKRTRAFTYDPDGSFRNWLWKVCRFEAFKYLNRRETERFLPLETRDELLPAIPKFSHGDIVGDAETIDDVGIEAGERLGHLDGAVREIQACVQGRVSPDTWEAFWLISICFWTSKAVAEKVGISQAQVYKANQRVCQMLQDEGRRRLGDNTTLE